MAVPVKLLARSKRELHGPWLDTQSFLAGLPKSSTAVLTVRLESEHV